MSQLIHTTDIMLRLGTAAVGLERERKEWVFPAVKYIYNISRENEMKDSTIFYTIY